jgi:hypothetical protein
MSYNSIEEPFVMKTDSLFLEVVGTQLLHIFYLKGLIRCQRQFRGSDCVGFVPKIVSSQHSGPHQAESLTRYGKPAALFGESRGYDVSRFFTWQNTLTSCVVTATLSWLRWQLSRGSVGAGAWTLAPPI